MTGPRMSGEDAPVELQPGVVATLVGGSPLPDRPRFVPRGLSVVVGPYRDGAEHERHYLDTIGSGSWHPPDEDELRFGSDDRLLRSLWLQVPERGAPDPTVGSAELAGWLAAPVGPGLLRLGPRAPSGLRLSAWRTFD